MDICRMVATRGTCPRLKVGALLVKDKRIISTGYNGVPSGVPHCDDVGCVLSPDDHCTWTIHAEVNAITYADDLISTRYTTMYVTDNPCANCYKAAYEAGVRRIVYDRLYKLVDYSNLGLNANQMPEVVQLKRVNSI